MGIYFLEIALWSVKTLVLYSGDGTIMYPVTVAWPLKRGKTHPPHRLLSCILQVYIKAFVLQWRRSSVAFL
jgi:hypothetical protein